MQSNTETDPAYGYTTHLPGITFDDAKGKVAAALKEEGFGILTEIDVQATFKAKLERDFRKYVILGACNPQLAHRSLETDLGIGLLLPCNVCVWEEDGGTAISMIRPRAMFQVVENEALKPVVEDADQRLRRAMDRLNGAGA